MPVLTALLLLSAATPGAVKVASSGFSHVNLDDKTADFFDEFYAQQLQKEGLDVITRSAVAALMGLERQKQLLGCSEESAACLAELAGALGVDALVVGSVAKFGGEFAVTVKLVSARNAANLFSESGRVEGDRALLDWLTRTARAMAKTALARLGSRPPAGAQSDRPVASRPAEVTQVNVPAEPAAAGLQMSSEAGGSRVGAWVATGTGIALGASSVVTYLMAQGRYRELTNPQVMFEDANAVTRAGEQGAQLQLASGVLAAGAAISAGLATWWFLSDPAPGFAVVPGSDGAVVLVQGRLP